MVSEFAAWNDNSSSRVLRSEAVAVAVEAICAQARAAEESLQTEQERLMQEVNAFFPGDVGVLFCLLLNYVELKPGEAIFLGPNIPVCAFVVSVKEAFPGRVLSHTICSMRTCQAIALSAWPVRITSCVSDLHPS